MQYKMRVVNRCGWFLCVGVPLAILYQAGLLDDIYRLLVNAILGGL